MTEITTSIGGPDPHELFTVKVTGCPCRAEDAIAEVVMALKEVREKWAKKDALPEKKPCGCGDAGQR